MATVPPDRTLEQRLSALEAANRVRSYRSRVKRELKAGRLELAEVLTDPDPELGTARVIDLLKAAPKLGRVKAVRALAIARVSATKTVDGLTPRQRADLVAALRTVSTYYRRRIDAGGRLTV